MICNIHNRLLDLLPHKLHSILDAQHPNLLPTLRLRARRINNTNVHRPRIPLIPILAPELKLHTLSSLQFSPYPILPQSIYPPNTNSLGPLPNPLPPPNLAPMKGINAIIRRQLIAPPIQAIDLRVSETVRDASDGFPEEGRVVRLVERLLGEALHDVGFSYEEGLQDCAEGEELEGCLLGGHCSEN